MRLAHSTRKRTSQAATATNGAASAAIAVVLSTATQRLVAGIRDDFGTFVDGFASLTTDRATLAPKFMRAFEAWAKETRGTFVDFVRVLDPKVPVERDGYKAHPTYAAADNLRRLNVKAHRETPVVAEEDRPASAVTALERLVATVMPIIDPTGSIWTAFVRELNWTPEQAQRIKERAAKLGAIKLPPRIKHALETHAVSRAA